MALWRCDSKYGVCPSCWTTAPIGKEWHELAWFGHTPVIRIEQMRVTNAFHPPAALFCFLVFIGLCLYEGGSRSEGAADGNFCNCVFIDSEIGNKIFISILHNRAEFARGYKVNLEPDIIPVGKVDFCLKLLKKSSPFH